MRRRQALSLGVIAALIVGIWAAWAAGNDPPPPTTIIVTDPTTTTTAAPTTTTLTTAVPPPTTTPPTSSTSTTTDIEARTEEVRQILEDLWFGWLHALYLDDRQAVQEVAATQAFLDDFDSAVSAVEFSREPAPDDLQVSIQSILRDSSDCLVVHRTIDTGTLLVGDNRSQGVDVLWPHESGWRLATGWTNPSDLWQQDCEATREELP